MLAQYKLPADSVWFITGCSSGMGESLASFIAKSSNRLVATARKHSALSYLPDSPNVLKVSLDVTSNAAVKAAVTAGIKQFGRIDVFVNNAGYGLFGDTEAATDEQARDQMDTNFWGAVNVTREALRVLREENPKTGQVGGVVCQITSMGGRVAYPGNSFYHASKFALEGFTEAVSKEMSPDWNIHFSIVEPGGVKTNYTGSSMVHAKRHPAYIDPNLPTNLLRAYKSDPHATANWADAKKVAEIIYTIIKDGVKGANGGKGGIPFRLPLGGDSWGMQKRALDGALKEFEVLKSISFSASGADQLDSIDFLKK